MHKKLTAEAVKELIIAGDELAILDVREEGTFSERHMLYASSVPLSTLERSIYALVPRRSAPIVLCDDDDGLSERAADRLAHFGYSDVSIMAGGLPGWEAAGHEIFSGVHVPSKAFGEFVEVNDHTPDISAEELNEKIESGADLVVLDSRPFDEYQRMNIPTGIDVPGAELVYRVHDLAPSPDTLVVVNCAGRTRSIIGAQSLINAGIPNDVVALCNGTMGWKLAGFETERGADRRALTSSPKGIAKAVEAAERVAQRFGIRSLDADTLATWMAERDRRTLYLFDVRNPEEYEAGHMPGSVSAPGGQLVQGTDMYAATRHARVVLIDDDGVRATMTASWLLQLGWQDVAVLKGVTAAPDLVVGSDQSVIAGLDEADAESISADALNDLLAVDAVSVIDLGRSLDYTRGHIPGAWFGIRSRLDKALAAVPIKNQLVITSGDGVFAQLAAAEAKDKVSMPVTYLAGGTAAWVDAGLPVTEGNENLADSTDDMWLKPYDRSTGVVDAMNAYLAWEIGLVDQIARDGTTNFKRFS